MAVVQSPISTALAYQRHGRTPPRAGVVKQRPPSTSLFEREYRRRLMTILRAWADHVETLTRRELRTDAFDDDLKSAWRALVRASGIEDWLRRGARAAAGNQARYVERVANLPVANAIPQTAVEDFLQENLSYIETLANKQVQQIADIVRPAQAAGTRWEEVAKQIEERLGVTQSRARLIARDQANKFNSVIAETTQTAAGIEEYMWITANDFAVRGRPGGEYEDSQDNHWRLHGKIFRWDSPPIVNPVTGERAHPGQAINCRCTAKPVIPDLFAQRPAPTRPAEIVEQERRLGYR